MAKDNTFRSSNPTITKRIHQIFGKKAWYGQTRQPESLGMFRAPSKSNLPYQNATRSCWTFRTVSRCLRSHGKRDNLLYECIEERELPENAYPEVLINATVSLTGNETSGQYPKPQAELPHQEFCGYLIQYRWDTDMDSPDYHTALCRAQTAGSTQMALFKPRFLVKAQHLYKNRPISMD